MTFTRETDHGTPSAILTGKDVTLTIDGASVTIPEGTSIMHAASVTGCSIPKLCATDTLESFGSCRLCLVEVEAGALAIRPPAPRRSPTAWSCEHRASG